MKKETNTISDIISRNGIMVIDGSMSTALEHLGADLNSKLWTARALAESPELVRRVHLDYFRAGADCGITCSYQATIPGLTANGYTREEAEKLIARSVEIFIEARQQWWEEEGEKAGRAWPLCLAGIGPYGAYLADGSEYRGKYGVGDDVLDSFHRRRMEILHQAGADILLIETQPSLHEALLAAGIAEELGADYWISFSCADEKHICEGDPIRKCAEVFAEGHPHLKMIGVNCTKPVYISGLIKELRAGLQTAGSTRHRRREKLRGIRPRLYAGRGGCRRRLLHDSGFPRRAGRRSQKSLHRRRQGPRNKSLTHGGKKVQGSIYKHL